MTFDVIEDGVLRLAGELTIHTVERACQELKTFLTVGPAPTRIDLAGLVAIDTAGAQLLLVLRRSFPQLGLGGCPEPIERHLAELGIEPHALERRGIS